jgi:hypothetical protein
MSESSIRRGSRPYPGGLNLAPRLAQLRRNPWKADRVIHLLLGAPRDAARPAEDAVLVDLETMFQTERANRDVVRFGTGEVVQRGAKRDRWNHPEIHLQATIEHHGASRRSLRLHLFHAAVRGESCDDGVWPGGRDENVNIADRILPAAVAAGHLEARYGRTRFQMSEQRLHIGISLVEAPPSGMSVKRGNPVEDLLFGGVFDARQCAKPSAFRGGFKFVERRHAQLAVDLLGSLRTQAGNAQHLHKPFRDLSRELLQQGQCARFEDRADLAGEVGTDPGQLVEPTFGRHRCGWHRQCFNRARCCAVRPYAERVLALNLEQVGDLLEDTCDVDVLDRMCRTAKRRRISSGRFGSGHDGVSRRDVMVLAKHAHGTGLRAFLTPFFDEGNRRPHVQVVECVLQYAGPIEIDTVFTCLDESVFIDFRDFDDLAVRGDFVSLDRSPLLAREVLHAAPRDIECLADRDMRVSMHALEFRLFVMQLTFDVL